ncbi:MAG: GntR family transcriptional regulator [Candidatus Abyssobacteria bacterium SURF_17]|uniref:GntR family transcriptional regulator n=1 Tax=Candidatus Abyssobacteria bacterium SURF_17 TaxID=2093361 RepID=A0A419ER05_9BACT|nr:MAG: GntR family transcriptional regulator [Candidatus Abyssubacteria bacterium SURF_17]
MLLNISHVDGVPIYFQIAREIKHSIAVGSLRPGEQLPSVREIAAQITVNPNTVAKAYRELEAEGIVETRRGTGTFVSEQRVAISREERAQMVGKLIDRALDEANHLRMDKSELKRLFLERIRAFKRESEENREAGK